MKTLLTIGYSKFLLPANANVNAVVAVLQKATLVREEYKPHLGGHRYYPGVEERARAPVTIELIPDDHFIDTKTLKALPEHASADAHNTF